MTGIARDEALRGDAFVDALSQVSKKKRQRERKREKGRDREREMCLRFERRMREGGWEKPRKVTDTHGKESENVCVEDDNSEAKSSRARSYR